MKALAVVDVDQVNPLDWQTKNPCYGMVSQGRKKLKKKNRRGMKSGKKVLQRGR